MNGKLSIIISVILVTAAILTVQSSSMLQPSYAQSLSFQSCPDGSTPDASGNCPTSPPPAGGGETQAPPAGDGETAEAPPATEETPPPAAPPATEETPPPAAPPATEETPPPAAPPAGAPQGSNNTDFVNTILEIHNSERAAVGVPPLVWSDILAADAQEYADHLAAIGKLEHMWQSESNEWSQKAHGANENLAAWTHGCTLSSLVPPLDYTKVVCPGDTLSTLRTMVMSWVNEKKDFSGTYNDVNGHYTQMIWKATTELGCGTATGSDGNDYLVCRYLPSGNTGPDPFA
jgi:uncharacterized protein YkwD